jgi:Zn-dependent protease with chaperone function
LHAVHLEALRALDCAEPPELFVSQTPFVNAGAYGMHHPFIVINSGTLSLMDDDELCSVVGHELGHIMSGHALYHTLLVMLLNVGLGFLPTLAGIALGPIRMGLLEWYRKSELSCDRAGLLASQRPEAALRVFLKLAGGGPADQMSLDAFLDQAREYDASTGAVDRAFKVLNTLGQQHPFATLRAAALLEWIETGHYDRILRGEYRRRDRDAHPHGTRQGLRDAADYYAREARTAVTDVVGSARRAAQSLKETLKKPED